MILGRPLRPAPRELQTLRRVATPESSPQVTLIVVDIVFLQQLKILFLKSFLPVMFALVLDVCDHIRDLGLTHGEPTLTVLPFKTNVTLETLHESTSMIRLSDIVRFRSG